MSTRVELEPVGIVDIADRLDVRQNTVSQWRLRCDDFPAPRWVISRTMPVWAWSDVEAWAIATGRFEGAL